MRDIKFRALSKNGFCYGLPHYSPSGGVWTIAESNGWIPTYNNPDEGESNIYTTVDFKTIGQYTGLKDKNGEGNEVFEGDLFECIFSNIPNGFSSLNTKEVQVTQIATVIHKMGMFQIRVFHPDHDEYVSYPLYDFLKNEQKVVIGNVHENPELLKS